MPNDMQSVTWPGWQTVRLIGQGSFGTVYEIQRQVFEETEKAALKVISIPQNRSEIDELYSDGYDEESITSTFQSHLKSIVAEYTLTRKMNDCVNIVTCEDVRYVQHDDGIGWDIFIKMELLTPLVKALGDEDPEQIAIRLGLDMCNALSECRKHEIVHRDIKPQNIFVSEAGDYKLGDFGIAKTVEKTTGGTKIGTYKYMAPEVYNNQPYGCSADIYSLGMVMYWLLNKRRMPFLPLPPEKLKVGMEETARKRRMAGEPLLPPACGGSLLKQVVLRACAFDPQERYQTPNQMQRDLLAAEQAWRVQHPELSGIQICPGCGTILEDQCRFCVCCGRPLHESVSSPVAEPRQTAQKPSVPVVQLQPRHGEVVIVAQPKENANEDSAGGERCRHCGVVLSPELLFCTQCGMRREVTASVRETMLAGSDEKTNEAFVKSADESQASAETEGSVHEQRALCPNCGATQQPNMRFCIICGVRLDTVQEEKQQQIQLACSNCGAAIQLGNKFCTQCGNTI